MQTNHAPALQLGGIAPPAPDRYRIAEGLSDVDRGYVVRTWTDSFHRARENYKRPIGLWKGRQRAAIDRILAMPGTRVLVARHDTARMERDGADLGPACLGWLVCTTGRGWPTVHYAFTRHALDGAEWRRRGVMAELVDAAELGARVVYTHRGEYARGSLRSRQHYPRGLDEEIAAWMRARGKSVAYVPLEEWIR
jgi:hypothetical protein